MCSKRAKRGRRFRAVWPRSILWRLAVLFTACAFVILLAAGLFLYWVLENNLAKQDNEFLAAKIQVLRAILKRRPRQPEVWVEELQWEGAALRFNKYYARILDAQGHTLMETPHMTEHVPPSVFPKPPRSDRRPGRPFLWVSPSGQTYRILAAWSDPQGRHPPTRLVNVALDISGEEGLMLDYRRKLVFALIVGTLLSAVAGIAVARRGLQPLEAITQTIEHITAARLHSRIEPSGWPRELSSLAGAFDEMLRRLEESFTKLSQFSADLAHELRNPINNLMGEAEVAVSKARTPAEYREVLESSLEEYGRLSRMIDSLLFLARAESSERKIEKTKFEARDEVDAVLEYHEGMADEQEIRLRCNGKAVICADPLLFRRVMSNLVSNALKYTPRGGNVAIDLRQGVDGSTLIQVNDNGAGIPTEHLPHVFDRFYRADPARSQSPQGTGLGLAIVKSIMELHGGKVGIQSQAGHGTAVTLEFPGIPRK